MAEDTNSRGEKKEPIADERIIGELALGEVRTPSEDEGFEKIADSFSE